MALDPVIAGGFRGLQLQDPLERYARVSQIQGAQQQSQLNQLQMQQAQLQMRQAQREQETTNALNAAYRDAYNPQTGDVDINRLRQSLATGGYGAKIPAIEKQFFEGREARTKADVASTELLDKKLKQSRSFLDTLDPTAPGAADAYIAWHEANHKDPVIGPALTARGVTAEQSRGRIAQMIQTPGGLARLINESKLGTEKFMELNKPTTQVIDQGGQRQVIQIPGLGGIFFRQVGAEPKGFPVNPHLSHPLTCWGAVHTLVRPAFASSSAIKALLLTSCQAKIFQTMIVWLAIYMVDLKARPLAVIKEPCHLPDRVAFKLPIKPQVAVLRSGFQRGYSDRVPGLLAASGVPCPNKNAVVGHRPRCLDVGKFFLRSGFRFRHL